MDSHSHLFQVARDGHFLDITSVDSPSASEVTIHFKSFQFKCHTEKADNIVNSIKLAVRPFFLLSEVLDNTL